ncbi:unnamed protein product [Allacma fusca]|uniref:F-box domain-containing protein n=1 Tax=Allacma fusca TaxID=39272 RepID=A0A8J2KDJ5_9HEXA|nr:unnamed protein product [Allacma fusca]
MLVLKAVTINRIMDPLAKLRANSYNFYRWGMPMPSIKNPLYIDVVFEGVVKYLDAQSIKACRQVCRKWNEVSTKILLERVFFHNFYEQVHADNFESLSHFISSNCRKSFRNLHIRGLSILRVYKELNLIGPQVHKLKFYRTSFETEAESSRELCRLLEHLPNLQCLHMDLNDSTEKLFYGGRMFGVDVHKKFSQLKELQLRSFDSLNKRTLENLIKIPWQLNTFEVTIDNRVPIELMRVLLSKMNATLTELNICFAWSYEGYNYDLTNPTEDNWIIPTNLYHLKKLKIGADRGNDPQILCRSLVAALQLPRLKTLKLFGESIEGSFGKMIFPRLWDLQSKSLTSLKLGSNYWDTSCFVRPISVWPNVKEVTLYFPSLEIISSVFANMENLEKLHLELKNDMGIQWDSALTGIKMSDGDANNNQGRARPSSRASIRFLKSLKSLKIEFPEYSPGFFFTDFFIYHGLIHLKELQYLHIRGEKFSNKALQDLKKSMRPLASINLVNCEKPYVPPPHPGQIC